MLSPLLWIIGTVIFGNNPIICLFGSPGCLLVISTQYLLSEERWSGRLLFSEFHPWDPKILQVLFWVTGVQSFSIVETGLRGCGVIERGLIGLQGDCSFSREKLKPFLIRKTVIIWEVDIIISLKLLKRTRPSLTNAIIRIDSFQLVLFGFIDEVLLILTRLLAPITNLVNNGFAARLFDYLIVINSTHNTS